MDRSAALRPLAEAAGSIRDLQEYRSGAELNAAVDAVATAIDRSLRLALRTDPAAPEGERLSALAPDALPLDRVVQSLRSRDVISLETAGAVHQLGGAATRARDGEARPADADVAAHAVVRVRADLSAGPRRTVHTGTEPAGPDQAGAEHSGTVPPAARPARTSDARGPGRWMAWLGAAFALLFVLGLAWVLTSGGEDHYQEGVAAFRAARWDSAAVSFERALQDRPVDVTAMLYLARSYRRLGRPEDAAEVLREAVRVAPEDADARRELGRVFMDLGQPQAAIDQLERALESDPASVPTWAALVQALRAAGDPQAERVLERAPAEVRAALRAQGG
jgi:tetratricopeptide (TPR) repeat protein